MPANAFTLPSKTEKTYLGTIDRAGSLKFVGPCITVCTSLVPMRSGMARPAYLARSMTSTFLPWRLHRYRRPGRSPDWTNRGSGPGFALATPVPNEIRPTAVRVKTSSMPLTLHLVAAGPDSQSLTKVASS
jgi:hypothetical protein